MNLGRGGKTGAVRGSSCCTPATALNTEWRGIEKNRGNTTKDVKIETGRKGGRRNRGFRTAVEEPEKN